MWVLNKVLLFVGIWTITGSAIAGCYEDWQEAPLNQRWHKIRANCVPEIARTIERKHHSSVEYLAFGRASANTPISVLRVSDNIRTANAWLRPSVLLVANMHPNEASPARSVLDWLVYALSHRSEQAYPGAPSYGQLFATRQVWIVPYHSQDAASRCNMNNVNLNRDYGLLWVQAVGQAPFRSSNCSEPVPDTAPEMESGPVPFSQSESRALAGLFKISQPSVFLSLHGHRTAAVPSLVSTTCPLPLTKDPDIGDNWTVTRAATLYSWTAGRYASSGPSRGSAGSYLTNPLHDDSLPRLSERHSRFAGIGARIYSPYSPADVCDSRPEVGIGNASRQARAWGWAAEGAFSVLLEHLGPDPHRPAGRRGKGYWSSEATEEAVQDLSVDVRAPITRLLAIADNPLAEADIATVDLAVEKIASTSGRCNKLELFSSQLSRASVPADDSLIGQFGRYRPKCVVRHWGNGTAPVTADVRMTITDLEQSSRSESSDFKIGPLGAGAAGQFEMPAYSFLEGRRYEVSCRIVSSDVAESDPVQTVTVQNDQGCVASGGSEPYCVQQANGTFDGIYPTNNVRSMRFKALVSTDVVCPNQDRMSVDVNGAIYGSVLPAIH